jgi:hypothetical protein
VVIHKPVATALARAGLPILYEGLPHDNYERDVFAKELDSKQTVRLNDAPFYLEPLPLDRSDADRLTALFRNANSFIPPRPKACGGFHADYCLKWNIKDSELRAQICFSCGEVKIFGPDINAHWDIAGDAYDEFKAILKRYAKNRPTPAPGMPGSDR